VTMNDFLKLGDKIVFLLLMLSGASWILVSAFSFHILFGILILFVASTYWAPLTVDIWKKMS